MTDYVAVLTELYSSSRWALNGDTYDGLVWLSDDPKPTQDDLDQAWDQVQQHRWLRVMRAHRDALLASSDWTQVADAPVDRQAWADYRQALRDFPATWTPGPTADFPEPPDA